MAGLLPTKGNLIAAKKSRELARTGLALMDKKRNILVREIMGLIETAEHLQSQIDSVFSEAYAALAMANITLGKCDQIAESVGSDNSLNLRYRSVMGVELPTVISEESAPKLSYGLSDTGSALDEAFIRFSRTKELIRKLAETENTIYRLAYAIKKTQKRANALRNIVIPNFDAEIKLISDTLEEREREEFARFKVIKKMST